MFEFVSRLTITNHDRPREDPGSAVRCHADRAIQNVDELRAQLPVLRWMVNRTHPPKRRDPTILDGGVRLGSFWDACKSKKRFARPPFDRLLTIPVLRADYRDSASSTNGL